MTKKSKRTPKRTPVPRSKCRALIPLDTAEIRKKELAKLRRQQAACAKLDADLERFEKEEKQAYRQWIQTHCGPAITQYRTLQAESSLLENTMALAYDLIDFYPNRTEQACANAAVFYFETNGQIPEGYESFFNPSFGQTESGSNPSDIDDDDDEEEDDAEYEDCLRDFEAFIEDLINEAADGHPRRPSSRSDYRRVQKAIKELYRRIARRLHPDGAGATTPAQRELWHAAQAAYENHDRETLERIDARCDLLDAENTKAAPVSSIQTGIAFYKNACARFRSAIRRAKREPEWGFLSWSEAKKTREIKEHQRQLQMEIRSYTRWMKDRQDELKAMRNPPAAPRRSASQKKSPPNAAKPAEPSDDQSLFDFF